MPVVLVPGFMADAGLWSEMVGSWAEFGPVTYGDLSRDGTIEGMARRVLADAPPRFVLVGFSMGGYVAREVARLAPGRVTALVLVATSSRGDTPTQSRRKSAAVARIADTPFGGLSRAAAASSLHPDRADDDAMIERVRAMGIRLGQDVFVRQSLLSRQGDRDRLGNIICPSLVIAAAQDRLRTLEEAEELRQGLPGATLQTVEGSGHMIPMEAPAWLAQTILAWLRGLPSQNQAN